MRAGASAKPPLQTFHGGDADDEGRRGRQSARSRLCHAKRVRAVHGWGGDGGGGGGGARCVAAAMAAAERFDVAISGATLPSALALVLRLSVLFVGRRERQRAC